MARFYRAPSLRADRFEQKGGYSVFKDRALRALLHCQGRLRLNSVDTFSGTPVGSSEAPRQYLGEVPEPQRVTSSLLRLHRAVVPNGGFKPRAHVETGDAGAIPDVSPGRNPDRPDTDARGRSANAIRSSDRTRKLVAALDDLRL